MYITFTDTFDCKQFAVIAIYTHTHATTRGHGDKGQVGNGIDLLNLSWTYKSPNKLDQFDDGWLTNEKYIAGMTGKNWCGKQGLLIGFYLVYGKYVSV